ncbi:MAG: MotA/TolQ/ExbB proton channel family protein [Gemmatimonadota bacterium]
MMELMMQGGYVMWVILAVTILIGVIGVRSWLRMRRLDGPDPVVETGIDAILFWGVWVVVVGLLGTFVGIYQAASVIAGPAAGQAGAALVWGGIKVALTPTLFGLLVFSLAALAWIALRTGYRRSVLAAA